MLSATACIDQFASCRAVAAVCEISRRLFQCACAMDRMAGGRDDANTRQSPRNSLAARGAITSRMTSLSRCYSPVCRERASCDGGRARSPDSNRSDPHLTDS